MTSNINATTEYSLQDDLRILTLMTNRITDYVRGEEIYGNQGMFVSGSPAVTLGGILMRMRRLNALREHLSSSERVVLDTAISQHDDAYENWTSHYETKVRAEATSRLDRIQQFIKEYEDDPNQYEIAFEPEQTRRTIIQEILYMMQRANIDNTNIQKQVKKVDNALSSMVEKSTFQWAKTLEEVYDSDEFWWLYSTLLL